MKWVSALITDARGSLGDTTWARNPYGVYSRPRRNPFQPRTLSQQTNRANFTYVTQLWAQLGAGNIAGWNALAATTVWVDSLGRTFSPSGIALFTKLSLNLLNIGLSPNATPPAPGVQIYDTGPLDFELHSTGGAIDQFSIGMQVDPAFYSPTMIVRMTPPFSGGATFMAKQQFRRIQGDIPFSNAGPYTSWPPQPPLPNSLLLGGRTYFPDYSQPNGILMSMTVPLSVPLSAPASFFLYFGNRSGSDFTAFETYELTMPAGVYTHTFYSGKDFGTVGTGDPGMFAVWVPTGMQVNAQFEASGSFTLFKIGQPTGGADAYTNYFNWSCLSWEIFEFGSDFAINPQINYVGQFPVPVLGQRIGVEVQLIDQITGYAGPISRALATLGGT